MGEALSPTCPVCGIRFRARRAGTVVPCPDCGNPVAVPEQTAPPPARERKPAVEAPQPAQTTPQMPWLLAAGTVVVLRLAHYALYLLISGDARNAIGELEGLHGNAVRAEVENPGSTPPAANSPKYKDWHAQRTLFLASRAYSDHEAHRSLVATGLAISILVQLVITGFALLRMNTKLQRQAGRGARGRSAGSGS